MHSQQSSSLRHSKKHKDRGVTLYSDTIPLSPELTETLSNLDIIAESPHLKIYKRETRKAVMRLELPPTKGGTFVVKGYPFERIRNRLRPARFGILEGKNMLQSEALKLKSPTLLGYFEFRKFGLIKANGVIMEALDTHKTLMEIAEADPAIATTAFNIAIPTIANLYRLGVNHIDISPHNIMVESLDHAPLIIDWQNCRFISPKNDRQLIFQAAQFLRYTRDVFSVASQITWASDLYDATSPDLPQKTFLNLVRHYTLEERPGKSVRYSLDFDLSPQPNA